MQSADLWRWQCTSQAGWGQEPLQLSELQLAKGHILDNLRDLTAATAGNKCPSWEQNPDFLRFMSVTMKDHLKLPNNPVITQLAGETKQIFQGNFNYTSLQGKFCTDAELNFPRPLTFL